MKNALLVSVLVLSILLSACATRNASLAPVNPGKPSNDASASTPAAGGSVPEVSTTLPDNGAASGGSAGGPLAAPDTVTLQENGQTFTMRVGDGFLLNLGDDVYNWDLSIDNQSVLALRKGVMVIKGAQGIFDAQAAGTAVLTAAGRPQCLDATPPCGMPTILFKVTVIVE